MEVEFKAVITEKDIVKVLDKYSKGDDNFSVFLVESLVKEDEYFDKDYETFRNTKKPIRSRLEKGLLKSNVDWPLAESFLNRENEVLNTFQKHLITLKNKTFVEGNEVNEEFECSFDSNQKDFILELLKVSGNYKSVFKKKKKSLMFSLKEIKGNKVNLEIEKVYFEVEGKTISTPYYAEIECIAEKQDKSILEELHSVFDDVFERHFTDIDSRSWNQILEGLRDGR